MTLDLDTTPLTRGLIAAMAGWFLSLGGDEQKEQPMNEQPHDAIAAARRVSVDEIARIAAEADRDAATMQAIEDEANMALFDERLAAAINSIDICRAHGGHHAWTSEHSAAIRSQLATFDALIASKGEPAPQGFGQPINTHIVAAMRKARDAIRAAEAASYIPQPGDEDGGHAAP